MKFLLDMNLPRELGSRLLEIGHEARHAGDAGLAMAADMVILREALSQDEVVLTHDLDYGQLLAFSGDAGPSVVIYRVRDARAASLFARLTSAWPRLEAPLEAGAIVVIEDHNIRVRQLPIRRRSIP